MLYVLGLAALPVRGDDQTACHLVCRIRPETAPHEVQAGVQCGCCAGRRQNVAVIDVEHRLIEGNVRVPDGEGFKRLPVRDRAAPRQQTGIRYGNGAKTEPQDGHLTPVRLLQHPSQDVARRTAVVKPRRHNDDVGRLRRLRPLDLSQLIALGCSDVARLVGEENGAPFAESLAPDLVEDHLWNGEMEHGHPIEGVHRYAHLLPLLLLGPIPSYTGTCATVGGCRYSEGWNNCHQAVSKTTIRENKTMTTRRRALILIDVQQQYFGGPLEIQYPPHQESLPMIARAVDAANAAGIPVAAVQHSAGEGAPVFAPGTPGFDLHPDIERRRTDAWKSAVKQYGSVYAGTDLAGWLRQHDVDTVTLVGYMTNNCVLASAVEAEFLGFATEVLSDATGAINLANDAGSADAKTVHTTLLALLHSNWAAVSTTDAWAAALSAGHSLEKSDLGSSAVAGTERLSVA